jgi:hypothetical protein
MSSQPSSPPSGPGADDHRLDLVRTFRADPIGRHSLELRTVLSGLRSGAMKDKYCLIIVEPHRTWAIGRFSGVRGVPPLLADNRVFHSVEEAEWAVFKLRWAEAGGCAIDEDAL